MPTPHVHADLIKKWADNPSLEIQYREPGEHVWSNTRDVPLWRPEFIYRIKPKEVKTEGYRRYVYRARNYQLKVRSCTPPATVGVTEISFGFVRWIDTEWQYETVVVNE